MRTIVLGELTLHEQTVAETFDAQALADLAGRPTQCLYRRVGDRHPPTYLHLATGGATGDAPRTADRLARHGADVSTMKWVRSAAGAVPDDPTWLAGLTAGTGGPASLLAMTVTRPADGTGTPFTKVLEEALRAEVDIGPTRANTVTAALWCQPDDVAFGIHEVVCLLLGTFVIPEPRRGTMDRIVDAGGQVAAVSAYRLAGSV